MIVSSMTGAAGLAIGFSLPWAEGLKAEAAAVASVLQAFVKIYADNTLEIVVVKAEMGQGVATSLAMLIAEELEAPWAQVKVTLEAELSPYYDPKIGGLAATFGSTSVRSQYQRLRVVGATVRDMLLTAAAERFQLLRESLKAEAGQILDANGVRICSFGDVARLALSVPVPENPKLKNPLDFKLIGQRIRRKDTHDKVEGAPIFGIDVTLPDMLYAAVRHHPNFGATLSNFADLTARVTPPYQLLEVPQALIMIGPSYWQAQRLLDQLPAQYTLTPAIEELNQAALEARLGQAVQDFDGLSAFKKGDAEAALASSEARVEASYFAPFLAHNTLEPMCCTAWVTADRCEFWIPTQSAQLSAFAIARALNRAPTSVKVHVTYLGGGFGRKVETDFVVQAALAARAIGRPVKLIWSRREDVQHDFYRPAFQARFVAGLGRGRLQAWTAKNAGPSLMKRNNPTATGVDFQSVEGFSTLPYKIEHQSIFYEEVDLGIPIGYWRSVGKSQNVYFVESFVDEIASALGVDPLDYRLELLSEHPRAHTVLNKVASMSGWRDPAHSQSLGLAVMEGFGSWAAMAVKVAVRDQRARVENIWCAVDCGQLVTRDGAEAQVEGATLFGLAAALYGKVTIRQGRVEQTLFGESPLFRLSECPDFELAFIESDAPIGGLGETTTPLVAPALCNALYRLTGQRVRRLPVGDFRFT
jgi:isoquinoline 1-oxidoreductase beta subunit